MMPLVSVVMSTHNDAPYLLEAVESILTQSLTDLELILIDDASSDATPQVIAQIKDPRLIVVRNEQNRGLTHSLNRGLALAQGRYIARMDADDIAIPATRLADQVAWMEAHPHVGMLCGDMTYIGPDGDYLEGGKAFYNQAGGHSYLRWRLLWGNPVSHITVLMHHDILKQHQIQYDPAYNNTEDYELWARLSHLTQLARADVVWAKRRVLSSSVSQTNLTRQLGLAQAIMGREMALLLGYAPAPEAVECLFNLVHRPEVAPTYSRAGAALLVQLYQRHAALLQPSPSDQAIIQGEAVGYLLRLARLTKRFTDRWAVLQALRTIKAREFYSWNGLKMAIRG